jgi:glycosyltransferase involved in cell wall biosynthesis
MYQEWIGSGYEKGLVSIIIPCHNSQIYLPECLQSIVEQEYRPIEVIVVDDGSTDATWQIICECQCAQADDIAVKCLRQSNHGAQRARNQACLMARGEYFQFLDSDDVLCRGKLTGQVLALKDNSQVDVVYGDGQFLIDLREGSGPIKGRVISIGRSADMVESLLKGDWVPPFAYLSRRRAVQGCGPWDENLRVLQDFEYFLRMAQKAYVFYYARGITGYYRKHSFSSVSEQPAIIRARTRRRILAKAEISLRNMNEFNEKRVHAMVRSHRTIARSLYSVDRDCFNHSIDDVLRLRPQFRPQKLNARLLSLIFGYRNYEKIAALIRRATHKNSDDWF